MAVLILLKCWTTRGNHATSSATIHPFCNDSFLYHILCLCFCSGLFHYYSQYIKTQVVPSVCADLNVNNRLVFTSRGCLLRQAWNRKYLNRSKWINSIQYSNSIFKPVGRTKISNENSFISYLFLQDSTEMEWRANGDLYVGFLLLRCFSWERSQHLLLVSIRT